jgi:methylthioribulose-1-phosphate dehydratase
MEKYPDSYAILVRRHGMLVCIRVYLGLEYGLLTRYRYVWGDNVHKAKTQCESIDYILQLAVEMKKLGLPWTK